MRSQQSCIGRKRKISFKSNQMVCWEVKIETIIVLLLRSNRRTCYRYWTAVVVNINKTEYLCSVLQYYYFFNDYIFFFWSLILKEDKRVFICILLVKPLEKFHPHLVFTFPRESAVTIQSVCWSFLCMGVTILCHLDTLTQSNGSTLPLIILLFTPSEGSWEEQ